ncbi:NAD(P)/FAD-dependent oxidoreductase [Oceanobacillus halophilus]|uniref:FAD-binding oxidoreductase n=1 Tax=Oceanobacillus halophilus TaxID=930130 RepID=A0A495A3C4_9BACI|nr:FAD-dependent oxidoreductase [Oceanobacillus halophilus]RKQ33958.1 FAD-binding oxidoreductase [Oceanobacillus halophilus]
MKKYIIVGAGIVGASTAYYLAKNGADVIVVDRVDKGQATDAAAGMICPWISQRRNKAWYRLAKAGAKIYPELVKELAEDGEKDTGYSQVGTIRLHKDEEKLIKMRDRAIKRREDATEIGNVTLLNETETKAMFPLLTDGYQAVHVSGGARVDGRAMRSALLRGAEKHGATVIRGNGELVHDEFRVTGVKVGTDVYKADMVIAATGAWMNELLKPLNIAFDVVPQKGQILHVQIPGSDTSKWPVVMPPTSQLILAFDQRILIGSTHEDDQGFDGRTTAGGLHEILSSVMDIAPGLRNGTFLETRVGFRPFTPGYLPVVGKLPGYEGLLLANGLGSSGLTTGPYIGQQLAKLTLGEELEIHLEDYPVAGALKEN